MIYKITINWQKVGNKDLIIYLFMQVVNSRWEWRVKNTNLKKMHQSTFQKPKLHKWWVKNTNEKMIKILTFTVLSSSVSEFAYSSTHSSILNIYTKFCVITKNSLFFIPLYQVLDKKYLEIVGFTFANCHVKLIIFRFKFWFKIEPKTGS